MSDKHKELWVHLKFKQIFAKENTGEEVRVYDAIPVETFPEGLSDGWIKYIEISYYEQVIKERDEAQARCKEYLNKES